jgi:hypothetical protein
LEALLFVLLSTIPFAINILLVWLYFILTFVIYFLLYYRTYLQLIFQIFHISMYYSFAFIVHFFTNFCYTVSFTIIQYPNSLLHITLIWRHLCCQSTTSLGLSAAFINRFGTINTPKLNKDISVEQTTYIHKSFIYNWSSKHA